MSTLECFKYFNISEYKEKLKNDDSLSNIDEI